MLVWWSIQDSGKSAAFQATTLFSNSLYVIFNATHDSFYTNLYCFVTSIEIIVHEKHYNFYHRPLELLNNCADPNTIRHNILNSSWRVVWNFIRKTTYIPPPSPYPIHILTLPDFPTLNHVDRCQLHKWFK